MSGFRIEKDTIGEVKVPADALWGRKPSDLATI